MRVIVGALAVAVLAGCATSSTTYGPDGRAAHSINCSGAALNWGMCMAKAGDLCGAKGYNVIDRVGEGTSVIGAGGGGLFGASGYNRSMVVACKT